MAKKDKMAQVLTQFKHLRFFDQSEGEILNNGGFTLAFRAKTQPTEIAGVPKIEVAFAFAECSIEDNFNKQRGRGIAYGRLQKMSEGFSDTFELTDLPEGFQTHLIQLGDSQVDIKTEVYDVARVVVEYFLLNFADALGVGSTETGSYGNLLENLLTVGDGENGTLVVDASVLDYEEPTIESAMADAAVTIKEISNDCIDKLDEIDLTDMDAAREAIAAVRSALASVIDVCSSVVTTEDEDEESDDEEADELDTEEDDGGSDDEDDEEDESDGDDEEGEDEGDDNPR